MTLALVDLRRQYLEIKSEIDSAVLAALDRTDFILGDAVSRFEDRFAAYCDVDHCVGVGSGTAALLLALEALGIGAGDEVIVPANTFIASAVPAVKLGARPVLVDCDERTSTIDVAQAASAITPRTAAIVAVHLYGQPADVEPLRRLCSTHGIFLVEDACQAHGARYHGRRVGGLGHVAAFSFYPGKNLGAYGDGGAVTTNDAPLAERVRRLRDLGQERKYLHVVPGWNERLDTLQAAILEVKLGHLDRWNGLRRQHASAYGEAFLTHAPGIDTPRAAPWAEHVWHLYVIRSAARDLLHDDLSAEDVFTGVHYPIPLHLQPALGDLGYVAGDFPVTERLASEILSLPMFPELRPEEIEHVVTLVSLADATRASARLEPDELRGRMA